MYINFFNEPKSLLMEGRFFILGKIMFGEINELDMNLNEKINICK